MSDTRRLAREWALNLGAVLGVLCILWTFAAAAFGLTPLVFRSGSMAPAISTGSLALAREVPSSDLQVGDVVSVTDADGVRVTHRIEALQADGDTAVLTLRGDANQSPDAATYEVTKVDRVVGDVPVLGYAVAAVASPAGVLLGVLMVGGLLWLGFGPAVARSTPRRTRLLVAGGAVGAVVVGALFAPTVSTMARWSDTATMTSGTVQAASVDTPGNFSCSGGLFQVKFTWSAVADADSYIVHYGNNGQSTTERTQTNVSFSSLGLGSGTAWVEAKRDFGSVSWTSAASRSSNYSGGFFGSCN